MGELVLDINRFSINTLINYDSNVKYYIQQDYETNLGRTISSPKIYIIFPFYSNDNVYEYLVRVYGNQLLNLIICEINCNNIGSDDYNCVFVTNVYPINLYVETI